MTLSSARRSDSSTMLAPSLSRKQIGTVSPSPLVVKQEDDVKMELDCHLSTLYSRDDAIHDSYRDVNRKLTTTSSSRRTQGPLQLPPSLHRTAVAIPFSPNNFTFDNRKDVRPPALNLSVRSTPNITTTISTHQHNVTSSDLSDSALRSTTSTSPEHGNLNKTPHRPRTLNQVYTSTTDLATHYGIPQFFPPAPRTTPHRPDIDELSTHPEPVTSSPETDYTNLCANYLSMLNQKPDATMHDASATISAQTAFPPTPPDVQALLDVIQASPEYRSLEMNNDFAEFLTSPFDDSPFDGMLDTPVTQIGMLDADILTSPILDDSFGSFGGASLFSDTPNLVFDSFEPSKASVSSDPTSPLFDGMYTMPSPNTPALDPHSLFPSPRLPLDKSLPSARKTSGATGTRKNITPGALVPIDAPTQPRKYAGPSATSRKDVPVVFARKRARSQAFGDEDDDLQEMTLPPNPTEQQLIEAKRRQNTIAARRSRKRKLEYQQELEDNVEHLKSESNSWRQRAMTAEALLKSHGIDAPSYA